MKARASHCRCLGALVIVVGLIGPVLTPAAGADSPWLYGIHWVGSLDNGADISQMTGGKHIWTLETVMTHDGYEQWGPEGQLAKFQGIVNTLGHTIIMRVQPIWGKAFPLPADTDPDLNEFLDEVTHTAQLFQNVCHIWFLGNEMNLLGEWGDQPLLPENYINKAVMFSDRIKAVTSSLGPQIVLVGPPAVGDVLDSSRHMGCTDYLNRMCDRINTAGYRDKFDGFAMHAYGAPIDDGYMDLPRNLEYFETEPGCGYQYQLGLLDAKSFASYPVYITEWNRYTGIGNSEQEYVTAQFLHNAFGRLNTWNQSHHPIVCACWFIYPISDPWWDGFSLLKMKNPGDQDHDAWHAFQYAAGFNYAAGNMIAPVIELSTAGWSRWAVATTTLPNDTFTVRNAGAGTLEYTITDNAGWLSVSPPTGTSTGEADTINVIYTISGLAVDDYEAIITVTDPDATNSPQTITVTLHVTPIPGDFDIDQDVDQSDFGHLQACYSGSGVTQTDQACLDADLDHDNDVDQIDLDHFLDCVSGPGTPADPYCTG